VNLLATTFHRITPVIHKISDYQNSVAAAVEEESTTTDEISRNIVQTAAR